MSTSGSNRLLSVFALLAVGCGAAEPKPPVEAAPTPGPVTPAATVSAAEVQAPAAPKPEPSPFHIVAQGRVYQPLKLFPLENTLLFGNTVFLAEATGDEVAERPMIAAKLSYASDILSIAGSWPNDAHAALGLYGGCSPSTTDLLRWNKDQWVNVKTNQPYYRLVAPYPTGGVIAVRWDNAGTWELTMPPSAKIKASPFFKKNRISDAWAMTALPNGTVFVAARLEDSGKKVVLVGDPTKEAIETEVHCGPEGSPPPHLTGLVAGKNGQVYAFGLQKSAVQPATAVLSVFDGKAWQCQSNPDASDLTNVTVAPDGTLLALGTDGERRALWKRGAGAQWRELALPEVEGQRITAIEVYARGTDDFWLTGSVRLHDETEYLVAHNRPAPKPLRVPNDAESRRELAEYRPPIPAYKGCETNFAMLYTLAKTAPPDFDFPLTREALKGHTEFTGLKFVEAKSLGKRYFGVMARSYDEGVKLVDLVKKSVKGSSPVLLCREPLHVTREIRFDLKTGAMLPGTQAKP